ncbi:hypothetical protein Tco_1071033 [Tanacetum coccineum]|uniref:Uncharacterized protein n=1 Tax=Tanacetum coccineum TaxID=301880 RepID=A0ABQ5HN54_9ASTR
MQEGKVGMGITLDAGLFVTKSSGTKSYKQDTSSRSENNTTHAVDVDIRPVNDQESSAEVDRNTAHESTNMTGSSRNSQEESYGSNDMAHNHYLEEARKKWIPTGKLFASSATKVDNEPPNSSNKDITNPYECEQTLNVSVGILIPMRLEESLESTQERIAGSGGAMEASKRRRSMIDYRIQQLSKGSSEGSGIILEVPDEPKDNSGSSSSSLYWSDNEVQDVSKDEENKAEENKANAEVAEKQAGNEQPI